MLFQCRHAVAGLRNIQWIELFCRLLVAMTTFGLVFVFKWSFGYTFVCCLICFDHTHTKPWALLDHIYQLLVVSKLQAVSPSVSPSVCQSVCWCQSFSCTALDLLPLRQRRSNGGESSIQLASAEWSRVSTGVWLWRHPLSWLLLYGLQLLTMSTWLTD